MKQELTQAVNEGEEEKREALAAMEAMNKKEKQEAGGGYGGCRLQAQATLQRRCGMMRSSRTRLGTSKLL